MTRVRFVWPADMAHARMEALLQGVTCQRVDRYQLDVDATEFDTRTLLHAARVTSYSIVTTEAP